MAIPEPIRALIGAYFAPGGTTLTRGSANDVSDAAVRAIEAGVEASTLGVLAGVSGSLNHFEIEALFRELMRELGIAIDDFQSAALGKPTVANVPTEPVARSVHLFELSNGPGGASLAHVHAYATLAELERVLVYYIENHADITARYDEALLVVWVVRDGKLVGHVDLRPFIDARFTLDWKRMRKAIPALEGKRAAAGELLKVDVAGVEGVPGSYLPFGQDGPLELSYGWNDLQYDEPPPEDWPA